MWLLKQETADEMRRMQSSAFDASMADSVAEFVAHREAVAASNGSDIMNVAGGTARINIQGVLTSAPDFMSWLFDRNNTTYPQIREALATAEQDTSVKRIELYINSPGGLVDGLFDTLAQVQAMSKPTDVLASQACSAAYAIAAAANGKITAASPAAEFGSIGVATSLYVDESVIDIASTEAPDKRPDVTTPEGQAVVRKHLDAVHELFAEAIAAGRGVSVADVNANYGRGAVMLAREAKSAGLIDKLPAKASKPRAQASEDEEMIQAEAVAEAEKTAATLTVVGGNGKQHASVADVATAKRKTVMTESELRAQHPDLFSAVFNTGKAKGAEEALKDERDRVAAHLGYGTDCGAMDIAIVAITGGEDVTRALVQKYMSAGRNRDDQSARQQETANAGAVADSASPVEADADSNKPVWLDDLRGEKVNHG